MSGVVVGGRQIALGVIAGACRVVGVVWDCVCCVFGVFGVLCRCESVCLCVWVGRGCC